MIIERPAYLEKLNQLKKIDQVKVLTGQRRSGKSEILKQFKRSVKEETNTNIIFHEFDDYKNQVKTSEDLKNYLEKKVIYNKKNYIFLDEIQLIDDFNLVINSFHKFSNIDIYLTGSNSKLLSKEIGTLLTGRHIDLTIYPFSFQELYKHYQSRYSKSDLFHMYLRKGGMPELYKSNIEDQNLINQYIETLITDIVEKDIFYRHKIQNQNLFTRLLSFLGNSIGSPVSSTNIYNIIKQEKLNLSPATIIQYMDYINDCYLFNKCYRQDINGKEILKTNFKQYANDISIFNKYNKGNLGSQLENVVYTELLKKDYKVYVGKTYKGEVDFIAEKNDKRIYFQVCYLLTNEETIQREFNAFNPIKDHFEKVILSLDNFDLSRNGILHKNIIDWMLEE